MYMLNRYVMTMFQYMQHENTILFSSKLLMTEISRTWNADL